MISLAIPFGDRFFNVVCHFFIVIFIIRHNRHVLHAPHAFFHFLAGFEGDDVLRRHVDFIAGPWIARFAGFALFNFEHTEIPQFDPAHFEEGIDDGVEGLLDYVLGLELGQSDPL